jgi:hypothetical protein
MFVLQKATPKVKVVKEKKAPAPKKQKVEAVRPPSTRATRGNPIVEA